MISRLLGNSGGEIVQRAIGQRIELLFLQDDALHFTMADGLKFRLFDDGQSCCEIRYMRTDDPLIDFIGATLISVELRDAPDMPDPNGYVHEVQFLLINTSMGTFTMSSHNEHNGYYGGFAIRAEIEEPAQ